MKKFKFALGAWTFLAGCFLFSCSSGLGESIDLEAPVLEITSPSHGQFVPKTFTLTGIATDNKKVNSVEIEYKYKKNGETISDKRAAILTGEKWECEFSFDGDYEVEFEAYAYDALKNGSDTSHQRIMLLIDSQDPETDKMSIVRGDYVARLYPLEEFTKNGGITEQKNDPKNKDNFQNEKITLVTTLNDNYGIGHISLDLYEVDKDTKVETLVVKGIEPDSTENKYSPRFTIKEDMLPQNIRTGLHYLRPHLTVADIAGNQTPEIHQNKNVFAWESEYNTPHVVFSSMQSDERILLQKGAPVIATVFDDDKIKSCYYSGKLVKDNNPLHDTELKFEKGSRDLSFEISTDDLNIGSYYFAVKVEDESGRPDGTYYKVKEVVITNAEAPVIIVDDPEENSAPKLEKGIFTIKGRVADNEEKLDKIAIAWLPNGNDDISKAEKFFQQSYAFDADQTYDGIKIYKLPVESTKKESENIIYYSFAKEFNFFEDFIVNGEPHNENKVFMIAAKDPTENVVTSTFRLSKISSAPKFRVGYTNYNEDGSQYSNQKPADNLMFTPLANRKTTFTIQAHSENGLDIREFSVTGNDNGIKIDKEISSPSKEPTITIDFGTTEASLGKVYRYVLYAKDQIGGESKETLTIQFDQFGVLTSITCATDPSHTFVEKDIIKLQANFDYKVYVNGNPYIQLLDSNSKEIGRAKYASGNNTNTLYFEYTVLEGIDCEKFKLSKIIIPEGTVFEGDIKDKAGDTYKDEVSGHYSIDSIKPYVSAMSPSNDGLIASKDNENKITITFTFNEPVTIEGGTIIMQRADNWYIPPVIAEDVFLKIFNEKANYDDKMTLCGTDDLSSSGKYMEDTLIPKGPYMQYTNGIKEDEQSKTMVPDLDTKFVLAYKYNIGDITGDVQSLRDALGRAGYHRAEIDASLLKSTTSTTPSTTYTLEIKDGDFIGGLVNGVNYNIRFTNLQVRDKAYNYNEEYKKTYDLEKEYKLQLKNTNGSYQFWVGPVATPVIRVDRRATNDTKMDGETHNPFNANGTFYMAQTHFKIDCVTPGANVSYGTRTLNTKENPDALKSADAITGKTNDKEYTIKIDNLQSSEFKNGTGFENGNAHMNNGTSDEIEIGENSNIISEKIYIRAQAATIKGMTQSAIGQEGAFKTVIHYYLNYQDGQGDWRYKNGRSGDNNYITKQTQIKNNDKVQTPLRIHGAQIPEGASYTAGWPLTANGNDRSDYQVAFTNGTDRHFYWVSWQILSNYTMQIYATDFQNPANTGVTYGMYHYCKNKNFYNTLDYK